MSNTTSVVGRRVLGLVFFLVLALFLALTVGLFDKTFTKVVKVDLITDTAGNALPPNADVKVRGLIVGEVRSASSQEGEVTLALAIQPDKAELIPSNATARLLPKTLFGERYVSLIVPEGDTAPPIQAGDTLRQDKSGNAVEVGQVLDGLLPLLQAIPPQDLANTLGALSQGLSGRGAELGLTLDRLEEIFGGLNTELPAIQEDLRGLADFSQTYSEAAPDLVNALDNLRTPGNTVVEKRSQVSQLLVMLTGTSASTADLLQANAHNIVTIAADSREALQLLGRYSPSFGCTLADFVKAAPIARELLALDDPYPGGRASGQFINPKGRYLPNQDEPRLLDDRGPACYDNVTAPGGKFPQYPGGSFNDGSYQVPSRNPGPSTTDYFPAPAGVPDQVPGYGAEVTPASYAGSKMEQDTLDVVYGEAGGMAPEDVPSWTTLVGAPTMRGTEVSFE
ncbi:MCE family protein [Rhodococcus jostii]|uniref:Virulence factor Mce family protein n=2 Tax=Rhodococcus jostii TaxID=132919 RepID=A0A1H5MJS5_RHOJO|nr:MCE family protein [Rhodococcus jostii]SEE88648.1 virulence factor Mce family protein [Rhodococcus jostii]